MSSDTTIENARGAIERRGWQSACEALADVDAAATATAELTETSEPCCSSMLEAIAAASHGTIELARGDTGASLRHLRDAHDRFLALHALHEAACVRVLLGKACRAAGDEEGALLQLRAAREIFERLGAKPDLARVDSLVRPGTRRDSHGLTPRERDVLSLAATGLANREVAERLCISVKTVERHMANIFRRLGISSRSAATAYAWEHGLVVPS